MRTIGARVALAAVVGVGCVATSTASAGAKPPPSSISGTVRAAGTGMPLAGDGVDLLESMKRGSFGGHTVKGPGFVAGTTTAEDGTYRFTGLAPSDATGYWVCFDPGLAGPLANYQPQCYLNQPGFGPFPDPFGFFAVPPSSTPIHLTGGQHVTGVDADMVDPLVTNVDTAGSVAGKVTQVLLNLPLTGVKVTAFNSSHRIVGQALTGKGGSYVISDLLASETGYAICFDGSAAKSGGSLKAYADKCYAKAAWSESRPPPMGATKVSVAAGHMTSGVNVKLTPFP